MSPNRTIKKYPNRRLYDTEESAYITLEGVRRLVMKNIPFTVLDNKSGQDITRSILLQIISEQEEKGTPVFSTELLFTIIRIYGDAMQNMVSEYLLKSLEIFTSQQAQVKKQIDENLPGAPDPLALMSTMAEQNMDLWKQWRDNLPNPLAGMTATSADKKEE